MKTVVLLATAAALLTGAIPATAALTSNALTNNALTTNALTTNGVRWHDAHFRVAAVTLADGRRVTTGR